MFVPEVEIKGDDSNGPVELNLDSDINQVKAKKERYPKNLIKKISKILLLFTPHFVNVTDRCCERVFPLNLYSQRWFIQARDRMV